MPPDKRIDEISVIGKTICMPIDGRKTQIELALIYQYFPNAIETMTEVVRRSGVHAELLEALEVLRAASVEKMRGADNFQEMMNAIGAAFAIIAKANKEGL